MVNKPYPPFGKKHMPQPSLFLPLFLIIAGAVWFLKTTGILPATATLVSIALAVAGIVVLVMDGINKQSVVAGPLLVYIGAAVYLKSQYLLGYSPLVALGMMVLGCLLLLSRSSLVPYKMPKLPEG
jgi:intracellular septation protein A